MSRSTHLIYMYEKVLSFFRNEYFSTRINVLFGSLKVPTIVKKNYKIGLCLFSIFESIFRHRRLFKICIRYFFSIIWHNLGFDVWWRKVFQKTSYGGHPNCIHIINIDDDSIFYILKSQPEHTTLELKLNGYFQPYLNNNANGTHSSNIQST